MLEMTLAVLLVAGGLLILLPLLPMGMNHTRLATIDTHAALFAEHLMAGMRANAATTRGETQWTHFNECALSNVVWNETDVVMGIGSNIDNSLGPPVAYDISMSQTGDQWTATVKVCGDGTYSATNARWFYTEFFYTGL